MLLVRFDKKKGVDVTALRHELHGQPPNHIMGKPPHYTFLLKPISNKIEEIFEIQDNLLISHHVINPILKLWQWDETEFIASTQNRKHEYFVYRVGSKVRRNASLHSSRRNEGKNTWQ